MRKEGKYQLLHYAERGCDDMKPTSFEDAIRLQFDTLMKKVIDKIIKNYERSLKRRNRREVLFCELPPVMVASLSVDDDYSLETTVFEVNGVQIPVDGDELCNALKQLSERNRNILLIRINKNKLQEIFRLTEGKSIAEYCPHTPYGARLRTFENKRYIHERNCAGNWLSWYR